MCSFYNSYLGKKLFGIENPNSEFFNTLEVTFVIGDNCIASRSSGDFQYMIVSWIWQERAPEKKDFLMMANFTKKID